MIKLDFKLGLGKGKLKIYNIIYYIVLVIEFSIVENEGILLK